MLPGPRTYIYTSSSFSSLSYDRSKASFKPSSPHSAIQSFLLQMRVSSSSFLRLLPCLPVISIPPCIFPSITRCKRQFLGKIYTHIQVYPNGTRRGCGVSVTPRPLFTPGKDAVPIVQEAGWAPGPVWTGAENLAPAPGFDPRTVQPVTSRCTD